MSSFLKSHKILLTFPVVIALLQTLQFVTMGVWVRMMDDGSFTPFQQVYIRILLSAVFAWIIFFPKISKNIAKSNTKKDWFIYLLRATMAYGVGVLFFTFAVQNAKLAVVSFVASLPIIGLLAWVMYRERLAKGTLPFILLSVVGLALLTQVSPTELTLDWGIVAAVVAMIGFDIGFLMARLHPKSSNNYQDTAILLSFGWLVPFFAVLISGGQLLPSSISLVAWTGLVLSIVTNIIGLVMINYIFNNMKAYVAGSIFLLEGVFAIPVGILLYREIPSMIEITGAAIILFCAYVIIMKENKVVLKVE